MSLTACISEQTDNYSTSSNSDTISSTESSYSDDTDMNLTANFKSDYEKCILKDYNNLDFSECSVILPDADYCYNLKESLGNKLFTSWESYNKFVEYCKFFFGDIKTDKILFSPTDGIENYKYNEKDNHPKVDDYIDKIKSGSVNSYRYIYQDWDTLQYLWWESVDEYPRWASKGEGTKLYDPNHSRVYYLPAAIPSEARYYNDGTHNDVKYKLKDGEVSIGDAIDFFENQYQKELPYDINENIGVKVLCVDVCKVDDDTYGYIFRYTATYKGIAYDYIDEYITDATIPYDEYSRSGSALMLNKNDMDIYVDLVFNVPEETSEPLSDICSLEEAIDIVNDKLTYKVKFRVDTVRLIYYGIIDIDTFEVTYSPKYKLSLYNSKDNLYYDVYVDVQTKQCTYIPYSLANYWG